MLHLGQYDSRRSGCEALASVEWSMNVVLELPVENVDAGPYAALRRVTLQERLGNRRFAELGGSLVGLVAVRNLAAITQKAVER